MNNEIIIDILKSKPMTFTAAEIEEMMNDELSKSPDQMDTDLIDCCAEILERDLKSDKSNEITEVGRKSKTFKSSRILLVAAIIIVLVSLVIPVSAKYTRNNVSNKIIAFYSEYFKVDLRGADTTTQAKQRSNIDLIQELKDKGVDNPILPSALLADDYNYDIYLITENDEYIAYEIKINNFSSSSGVIHIIQYVENESFNVGKFNVPSNHNQTKELSVNNIDVIISGNKDGSSIFYINENIEYTINLSDCNFEFAEIIAKTIS